VLSEELKATIQEGYRAFLKTKDFRARLGQKQMVGRIASFLGSIESDAEGLRTSGNGAIVIEAGTGTGKTASYLLSVLPIAHELGKKVVVATGTVALQGQLAERDIPDVMAATGWDYSCALAKGRGRYLCPLRLQQNQDGLAANQAGLKLYEDEISLRPDADNRAILEQMTTALAEDQWNGDRDSWSNTIPDLTWQALTVDRNQCLSFRCRMFSECCFFQARAAMDDADCIVANHDLVLADLMLGGGVILPAPEDCIYIFDEAHKLGDTALNHFASFSRLTATAQWLEQIEKSLPTIAATLAGVCGVQEHIEQCLDISKIARLPVKQSVPVFEALLLNNSSEHSSQYRFPNGQMDDDVRALCAQLSALFVRLESRLDGLHKVLDKAMDNTLSPVPNVDIEQHYQHVGQWLRRANGISDCWSAMARPDPASLPAAKWLTLEDSGDIRVSVSPIIAGPTLKDILWQRCYAGIATSATLKSMGSFTQICRDLGLNDGASDNAQAGEAVACVSVPVAFDYAQAGVLVVPDIGVDGGQAAAHTLAVGEYLSEILSDNTLFNDPADEDAESHLAIGSLVLFSSRRQMNDVAETLKEDLPCQLLVQGELSVAEMVNRHRQSIDDGQNSVIFGLASFAEGMDLPGNYCKHVVIAKLPFAVPDDPLQAALAEWIEAQGGNAFRELTLPGASLRLIQASGRLLRNESDTGRVTILDRRLLTKFYGRQLLDSMPPFRRLFD
jgi:ATP-dependent DNA helicase DinG